MAPKSKLAKSPAQQINNLLFLPEKMQEKLMPFQKEGVEFGIRKNGRCLIADEMGLGKTLQALAIAYYYREEWPLLIVVPSSLRYCWIEEVERWLPQVHPHDINLIQSGADVEDIQTARITMVTYGLLRHPASKVVREALYNQQFRMVIVDESHYIKNRKTASTKFLVPLLQRAEHKLLLTGTPALSRPEELFPQLDALLPGQFGSWTSYAKKFCDAQYRFFGRMRRWVTDGASNLEELQTLLSKHAMIRRLKKNVLTQLPPKQRQRIAFQLKDSEVKKDLDAAWDELQVALGHKKLSMNQVLTTAPDAVGGDAEPSQEVAPGPSQGPGSFQIYSLLSNLCRKTCAAKIGPVKEYLKMLCENKGMKMLVFAYHHLMMDSLSEQLMDDHVKFIRIDGKTVQQDRPRLVHQFQVDPDTQVAVLSIKAAGVGLTLTSAKVVVFAELDWTPGTLEQAEDRAHRIGQTGTVHVHYLVARGTLDEWVWAALARKTTVVTTTLNGEKQTLTMDAGHQCQVRCLDSAAAYVPTQKKLEDPSSLFQDSQVTDQKTMFDFFTPKGKKTQLDLALERSRGTDPLPRAKASSLSFVRGKRARDLPIGECPAADDILVIQDSDPEDFDCRKRTRRKSSASCKRAVDAGSDETDVQELPPRTKRRRSSSRGQIGTCAGISNAADGSCTPGRDDRDFAGDNAGMRTPVTGAEDSGGDGEAGEGPNEISSSARGLQTPTRTADGHTVAGTNLWDCGMCTFLNHQALPFCEMCQSPRLKKKHKESTRNSAQDSPTGTSVTESSQGNSETDFSEQCESHFGETSRTTVQKTSLISTSRSADKYPSARKTKRGTSGNTPLQSFLRRKTQPRSISYSERDSEDDLTIESGSESDFSLHEKSSVGCDTESDVDLSSTNTRQNCRSTVGEEIMECESLCAMESSLDGPHLTSTEEMLGNGERFPIQNGIESKPALRRTPSQDSSELCASASEPFASPSARTREALDSESVIDEEVAAAKALFSPAVPMGGPWKCKDCWVVNEARSDVCDGCLGARPEESAAEHHPSTAGGITGAECPEDGSTDQSVSAAAAAAAGPQRVVDLDKVAVHELFQYCCSKNTSRVFLYDKEGTALNVNFIPLDVELGNFAELPDLLLRPENLKHIRRFIREWDSLAPTKRRMVVRSGEIFTNPCILYEALKTGRKGTTQRYLSKAVTAAASISKAEAVGGSVRIIHTSKPTATRGRRPQGPSGGTVGPKPAESQGEAAAVPIEELEQMLKGNVEQASVIIEQMKGLVQAVDAQGCPLCVHCQKPYHSTLVTDATIRSNPWQTRFCSRDCAQQYWMHSHREYSRAQVYEAEHGVCQLCGLDADQFFTRIRNTRDLSKRAELIQNSKYSVLKSDVKERMARNPQKGLFWQVDHIKPVSEGGGTCDIDNLRTLCVMCHRDVTSKQTIDRAKEKRMQRAALCGDITAFFHPK